MENYFLLTGHTLRELSPQIVIVNAYGPTECTITCCAKRLESSYNITIGGQINNTIGIVVICSYAVSGFPCFLNTDSRNSTGRL